MRSPAPGELHTRQHLRNISTMRLFSGLVAVFVCSNLAADDVLFERDVRPILKRHCFQCHGEEEKPEAGLDLRLVRSIQKGGESGAGVVAGDHMASLIFQRVANGEMPPDGKNPLT